MMICKAQPGWVRISFTELLKDGFNYMKKFLVLFVSILLLFTACKDESRQGDAAGDSLQVVTEADSVRDSEIKQIDKGVEKNSPAWFKSVPAEEGKIIVAAFGKSSLPTIAEEKALLKAQTLLAEQIELNKKAAAGGGIESTEEITETDISGFRIREQKKIKAGKKWIAYILLEKDL